MKIEDLKKKTVGFISLGCDKNRVDLEKMISAIKAFGMTVVSDPMQANIIIVNTCSFLKSARMESIENIVEMGQFKTAGCLEKLLVTGCLNELNYSDMSQSLPEVDAFVSVSDNENIVGIIAGLYGIDTQCKFVSGRVLTTPSHYAYLKISEGCNNFCSYCLIPYIRGRYKSTPMEELLTEAKTLSDSGVKELIIVAQDVTKYGIDLYGKKMLVPLLQELSKLNFSWIRLLYCYPEEITDELICEIRDNPKIVKYIDIPLQHVSTNILKLMNRKSDSASIFKLLSKLKSEIPNIAIRSTFIIGFPGESESDVDKIEDFLKTYNLYNVGFFKYSREKGTRSYDFENQVPSAVKVKREKRLARVQYDISHNLSVGLIGKVLEVLIDDTIGDRSIGRFYGQAPEIDGVVYVNEKLNIGQFYKVKITKVEGYDLIGERV